MVAALLFGAQVAPGLEPAQALPGQPSPGQPVVRSTSAEVRCSPDAGTSDAGTSDFGTLSFGAPHLCAAGSVALRREVAATVDTAVDRVSAIWGTGWSRQVLVIVPSSQQQASQLLGPGVDLDPFAAVATADRVIVNPRTFLTLNQVGRELVLTHEVMHLASRAATGPFTPLWLVEGLADYAGYQQLAVPRSLAAEQVRQQLQQGRRITALPARADFSGSNPSLAATYEQAWLAVLYLAERFGQPRLLALYRTLGRAESSVAAEQAFSAVLGLTPVAFERDWAAQLPGQL